MRLIASHIFENVPTDTRDRNENYFHASTASASKRPIFFCFRCVHKSTKYFWLINSLIWITQEFDMFFFLSGLGFEIDFVLFILTSVNRHRFTD